MRAVVDANACTWCSICGLAEALYFDGERTLNFDQVRAILANLKTEPEVLDCVPPAWRHATEYCAPLCAIWKRAAELQEASCRICIRVQRAHVL